MVSPRILAFAGSTRSGSFNKKLIAIGAAAAREAGAEVTLLDLRDLALPLYDGDLEAESGLPEGAKRLKGLMIPSAGLLIASAEYNSGYSAVLKNAIDWASRPAPGEPSLAAFNGKVAGLLSASPGALGGLRGLAALRSVLGSIGVLVLPEQATVPKADAAFDAQGRLTDAKTAEKVALVARRVVEVSRRLTT